VRTDCGASRNCSDSKPLREAIDFRFCVRARLQSCQKAISKNGASAPEGCFSTHKSSRLRFARYCLITFGQVHWRFGINPKQHPAASPSGDVIRNPVWARTTKSQTSIRSNAVPVARCLARFLLRRVGFEHSTIRDQQNSHTDSLRFLIRSNKSQAAFSATDLLISSFGSTATRSSLRIASMSSNW